MIVVCRKCTLIF